MSPDNLPSSTSVRKSSHFKSSKEDQNCPENGRIPSSSNGNSTSTTSQQQQQQQQNHQQDHHHHHQNNLSHINSIHHQTHAHESSPSRSQGLGSDGGGSGGSGDILLQWGQRKRSRCSRTEGRSVGVAAVVAAVVLEKHQTTSNHILPPAPPLHPPSLPSTSSNIGGSRSVGASSRVRSNGLLSTAKDGFLHSKNRNIADQMGCTNNASPSRNGGSGSRAISRSSVGKRSPSCIEKNDKKIVAYGSIRKVKSDDSLPYTGNGSHLELAHGEQDNSGHATTTAARSPVADADKGSGEVVEWPRIYLSLSRKEKEDDFYAMKGTKLPHRPKKRAKAVDRALQYCFPGLWLSDLTRARYEVRERKSTKKPKRRGLKGLENMDSESE